VISPSHTPPVGFELPNITTSEWPQTHALDSAANVIAIFYNTGNYKFECFVDRASQYIYLSN